MFIFADRCSWNSNTANILQNIDKNNNRKRYFFECFYFSEALLNTVACYVAKCVIDGRFKRRVLQVLIGHQLFVMIILIHYRPRIVGALNNICGNVQSKFVSLYLFFSPSQNRGWNSFRQTLGTFLHQIISVFRRSVLHQFLTDLHSQHGGSVSRG